MGSYRPVEKGVDAEEPERPAAIQAHPAIDGGREKSNGRIVHEAH
jgi:hypothetical protein